MQKLPLVSVVIPAYNCEKYIERALKSVLIQTYPHIECIVIDDGSTDGTSRILNSYRDRAKCVRQSNAGASAARNHGISLAIGKYIAFLDADDFWGETKIENQVRVLEENSEIALLSTKVSHTDNGELMVSRVEFDPEKVILGSAFTSMFLAHPVLTSVMMRSSVLKQLGGFDRSFVTAEDVDLYFRCCSDNGFGRIDQVLSYKQAVPNSLGGRERSYADYFRAINDHLKRHPDFETQYPEIVKLRKLAIYKEWVKFHLYYGNGFRAREILKESKDIGVMKDYSKLYVKSFYCRVLAMLKRRTNYH
jgi:glycosyltransferase involved in cell wall biosynthesis